MHTPAGFWSSRKEGKRSVPPVLRELRYLRKVAPSVFVRLSYLHARFSSSQTSNFHPFLSFQTSNFHPCPWNLSSVRHASLKHLFVLIFSPGFDLLAHTSGLKIMEKMSYSLHCIHFMFFLLPRESVQAFQDEERGESSSVAVSRVEPCLPTGFYIISLEDDVPAALVIYRACAMQDRPDEESIVRVLVYVSCFLYMHCFSCTPWSQLIIDSGDVMSPSVSKDEKLPGLVIFSSVNFVYFRL